MEKVAAIAKTDSVPVKRDADTIAAAPDKVTGALSAGTAETNK